MTRRPKCAQCREAATVLLTLDDDAPSPRCSAHWRAEANAALEAGWRAYGSLVQDRTQRSSDDAYDRYLERRADLRDDDQHPAISRALEGL